MIFRDTDYYPFGMQMPGRKFNSSNYRFGFQGQEKDDELKGNGNHISFDARGYDPRLGRWLSVDPLFAKYPWQSPYNYVGNSPIQNIEVGGKDYEIHINHETKTITIKAVYYTEVGKNDDHNTATEATKYWNDRSGKFNYVVTSGGTTTSYSINFDLRVIEVESPINAAIGDHMPDRETLSESERTAFPAHNPSKGSNTFEVMGNNEFDKEFNKGKNLEEDPHAGGTTEDGQFINVPTRNKDNASIRAHEVGHTLGIDHTKGLMRPTSGGKIIEEYTIRAILGKAGFGENIELLEKREMINKQGTVYLPEGSETGTRPSGFDDGKVEKKIGWKLPKD